jgi:hypothetical protein
MFSRVALQYTPLATTTRAGRTGRDSGTAELESS